MVDRRFGNAAWWVTKDPTGARVRMHVGTRSHRASGVFYAAWWQRDHEATMTVADFSITIWLVGQSSESYHNNAVLVLLSKKESVLCDTV